MNLLFAFILWASLFKSSDIAWVLGNYDTTSDNDTCYDTSLMIVEDALALGSSLFIPLNPGTVTIKDDPNSLCKNIEITTTIDNKKNSFSITQSTTENNCSIKNMNGKRSIKIMVINNKLVTTTTSISKEGIVTESNCIYIKNSKK